VIDVSVHVTGAEETAEMLERVGRRSERPSSGALHELGRRIAAALAENVTSEGRRAGVSWPALKAATVRERLRKGFGAGPRLRRTGGLLASIRIVSVDERGVFVAAEADQVAGLDVRFPFVGATALDVDAWVDLLAAQFDQDLGG